MIITIRRNNNNNSDKLLTCHDCLSGAVSAGRQVERLTWAISMAGKSFPWTSRTAWDDNDNNNNDNNDKT